MRQNAAEPSAGGRFHPASTLFELTTTKEQKMSGNGEYKVGYGRPPKETRFKKGQVVNRQRTRKPKENQSYAVLIDQMFARQERVTINGEPQWLTIRELITKQMVNKAANGDEGAARLLMRLNRH